MWRKLQISSSWRSASSHFLGSNGGRVAAALGSPHHLAALAPASSGASPRLFSSDAVTKKTVDDVMPIVTGHEREEIEAELEGKKRFDMDAPCGPFGTKEAPAIIQSHFNKRIVGCPGGEGEDEHDVVWFWLEKDKPHECPVCSQCFMLEVVGAGGSPDGHGDKDDH